MMLTGIRHRSSERQVSHKGQEFLAVKFLFESHMTFGINTM
ncbi:hypothetical protein [Endozoicomonas sp. ALE010]